MKINKKRAEANLQFAKLWLDRSIKDFQAFKMLVPFNKRTNKPVRCSDPALAIYLLQQSIEKAVKAAAIASEQYENKDFHRYSHNSLALILNLNNRMLKKINSLGLGFLGQNMGIDLASGEIKLVTIENQVTGKIPLLNSKKEKVDFNTESIGLPPEIIDNILDSIINNRNLYLNVIRATFNVLPSLGIHHGQGFVQDPQAFINTLSSMVTGNLNLKSPSQEQLKAPIDFVNHMISLGFKPVNKLERVDTIDTYLGVWAFSYALLMLTYLTFAHESTTRYPIKQSGNVKKGKIGCNHYIDEVGIVHCIGKMGYVTSITLNDLKNSIEEIATVFAVE